MKTYLRKIVAFFNDEEGAVAVEYALLVGLLAVAIAVGAGLLGNDIKTALNTVGLKVKNNTNAP